MYLSKNDYGILAALSVSLLVGACDSTPQTETESQPAPQSAPLQDDNSAERERLQREIEAGEQERRELLQQHTSLQAEAEQLEQQIDAREQAIAAEAQKLERLKNTQTQTQSQ